MKTTIDVEKELTPEGVEREKNRRRRRARRKRAGRIIDRIFGFFLATGIMVGLAGLALEYVLIEGPSPALRETFVMTMLETRRFDFIPHIFLSNEEVDAIMEKNTSSIEGEQDLSLIQLPKEDEEPVSTEPGADAYGLVDEDGDGIIFENITGPGFVGYIVTILDPHRVFVGMPDGFGGYGMTLENMCKKYDALGGVNGGGFLDKNGAGTGGQPQGLTIVDGIVYNQGYGEDPFAGFDADGIFHVGYFTSDAAENMGIVNGVSFQPILIYNGEDQTKDIASGVNPRTAVAQRGDGAVIMLVIDGRQDHSIGATYSDVADILLKRGAVNAINMDGGSSSNMYYDGAYRNKCSSADGIAREIPDAFLFR